MTSKRIGQYHLGGKLQIYQEPVSSMCTDYKNQPVTFASLTMISLMTTIPNGVILSPDSNSNSSIHQEQPMSDVRRAALSV